VSYAQVWRAAQERLRPQMTGAQFDTWLRGTSLAPAGDGAAVLGVRTTFAKEMLETRFRERIEAAVRDVTGKPCRLRIVVASASAAGAPDAEPEPAESAEPVGVAAEARSQLAGVPVARRAAHQGAAAAVARSLFDVAPLASAAEDSPASSPAPRPMRGSATRPLAAPRRSDVQRRIAEVGAGGPLPRPGRSRVGVERGATSGSLAPAARAEQPGSSSPRHQPAAPVTTSPAPDRRTVADARDADAAAEIDGGAQMNRRGGASGPLGPSGDRNEWGAGPQANGTQPPRLNPRYTFSTFIVGSGNQLAHAASQAVAEAPGQAYNPLFLYGGVGLGKTHLLHAIGHSGLERGLVVLYVSSETFTNDIVNAIRYRTTEEFRAKYRSVDVLLVDDIQFIAGKESTEEEFFHTFNSLYEMSKQIVICSDRPPKAIVSLEERLRSRFEWGLIADIQPPDLETRVAILRAKADMMARVIPDEVIQYLASRIQSNIRELEGSLNRLLAFAQLQHMPLTIDTAKAALASLATDSRQKRVTIGEILEAVADYYRIPIEDLCGKQRDKHIVVPRQIAMYLMRQETEASLLEIGQALGGRDHSTVLHGCEKITREVNDNTALRKEVLAIRQQLLG
jgi:chromosomal replication initiator protein